MRKIIVIILLVSGITCNVFAQHGKLEKDTLHLLNNTGNPGDSYQAKPYNGPVIYSTTNGYRQQGELLKDTSRFSSNSPYYLVKLNDKIIPYSAFPILALIGPQQIDAMEIYSGKKADSLYAGSGEKGLLIVKIKKDVPTYSKSAFYKKYNIKNRYESLPVYVDSVIAYHTDKFMFPTDNIKSVTVSINEETGSKFINILTKSTQIKYNPNEHYIRGLAAK